LEQVKQVLLQANRLVRQLMAENIDVEGKNFVHQLSTALPSWMMERIFDRKSNPTMAELLEEAKSIIKQKNFVERITPGNKHSPDISNDNRHSFSQSSNPKNSSSTPPRPCRFCQGNHWNNECHIYATPKIRRDRAMQLNLCERCLSENHSTVQCPKQSGCSNCSKPHHQLLSCGKQVSSKFATGANQVQIKKSQDQNNFMAATTEEIVQHSILMSKEIAISSESTSAKSLLASTILDTGGSMTLIRKSFVQNLDMPIQPAVHKLITLNRMGEHVSTNGKVDIYLKLTDKRRIKVTAHVIENISSPILMAKNVPNKLEKVHSWNMDKDLVPTIPDILIGISDFLDLEVKDTGQKMDNGLHIINSSIGIILCGKLEATDRKTSQERTLLFNKSLQGPTYHEDSTERVLFEEEFPSNNSSQLIPKQSSANQHHHLRIASNSDQSSFIHCAPSLVKRSKTNLRSEKELNSVISTNESNILQSSQKSRKAGNNCVAKNQSDIISTPTTSIKREIRKDSLAKVHSRAWLKESMKAHRSSLKKSSTTTVDSCGYKGTHSSYLDSNSIITVPPDIRHSVHSLVDWAVS